MPLNTVLVFRMSFLMIMSRVTSSLTTAAVTVTTGSLKINYTTYEGKPETHKSANIPVVIERRMCEAYTNGKWEEDSTNRAIKYMSGHKVFD